MNRIADDWYEKSLQRAHIALSDAAETAEQQGRWGHRRKLRVALRCLQEAQLDVLRTRRAIERTDVRARETPLAGTSEQLD